MDLEKKDQNVTYRNLRIFENQLVITGHGIHTPFMANKMNHLAIRPGVVHKKWLPSCGMHPFTPFPTSLRNHGGCRGLSHCLGKSLILWGVGLLPVI